MAADPQQPQPEDGNLPAALLQAIAYPGGGRVVLVTGAGCSVEAPTRLPLADQLARDCFRQLVEDLVLEDNACESPDDLSAVADSVFAARNSQRELVERFPPDRFRRATPNEGHTLAAALMREGAISNILSLNFDLAQDTALSNVGAAEEVATIVGPGDHHRLIARNLVYLHRCITSDPDELILRTMQLEEWMDRWEEVVAQRVIGGSVTVFVGLGSPAGVLLETTSRILGSVEGGALVYVVDPADRERSQFFAKLGLGPDTYVQLGWTEFMRTLSDRVVREHVAALSLASEDMTAENGWHSEDVAMVCAQLRTLGLFRLGRLRAQWLLRDEPYTPHPTAPEVQRMLADLIIGLSMLQRLTGRDMRCADSGIVEFEDAEGRRTSLLVGSGGGHRRWAHVEGAIGHRIQQLAPGFRAIRWALVAGVAGGRTTIAPPPDITGERVRASVVTAGDDFAILTVDELRSDPGLAAELVA
jgi:hypothetical protein